MPTKEEEIGAALMLLLDGLDPKKIAAALHAYLKGARDEPMWAVFSELDALCERVEMYSVSVDGFINDMMEEDGQTYTGTRQHLYRKLQLLEMSDRIYDEMRGTKEEVVNELKDEGFVREFRHHKGCPSEPEMGGDHYRCTCTSEAEEKINPS